jgi:hypothetical protein
MKTLHATIIEEERPMKAKLPCKPLSETQFYVLTRLEQGGRLIQDGIEKPYTYFFNVAAATPCGRPTSVRVATS